MSHFHKIDSKLERDRKKEAESRITNKTFLLLVIMIRYFNFKSITNNLSKCDLLKYKST